MMQKRVSSGVAGLDVMLGGGFIKGRTVLLAGGPGTGKSILTWHYVFEGLKNDEPAILLSLDQPVQMIQTDMQKFGWNPEEAIEREKLTILSGALKLIPTERGYDYIIGFDHPLLREQPFTIPRLTELVRNKAEEIKAKRVVIDGLGPLLELAGNKFEVRQMIYSFVRDVSMDESTIMMTHELRSLSGAKNDEMPYFIADAVIKLDMNYTSGDFIRTLRIVKIRGTSHMMKPVLFKIEDSGITVFPEARIS